jgi:predicted RNase H-like nuclease (RuvC/YqgF family)
MRRVGSPQDWALRNSDTDCSARAALIHCGHELQIKKEQIEMNVRALALLMTAGALVGCGTNSSARDAKREQDRMAMRLQDADKEKTQMQAQIDQLKANLESANARSKQMQDEVTRMQTQLRESQANVNKSQANAAAAVEMQRRLADLQAQNETLSAQVKALQQQLATARDGAAKGTPPATQPTLNK